MSLVGGRLTSGRGDDAACRLCQKKHGKRGFCLIEKCFSHIWHESLLLLSRMSAQRRLFHVSDSSGLELNSIAHLILSNSSRRYSKLNVITTIHENKLHHKFALENGFHPPWQYIYVLCIRPVHELNKYKVPIISYYILISPNQYFGSNCVLLLEKRASLLQSVAFSILSKVLKDHLNKDEGGKRRKSR